MEAAQYFEERTSGLGLSFINAIEKTVYEVLENPEAYQPVGDEVHHKRLSSMRREDLLAQIKQHIHEIEPDSQIILYGSRSRGGAGRESDWDLLILVDGLLNDVRIDKIRHRLYEIEWEWDEIISSIIRTREEWNSPQFQAMPFHKRIEQEGIRL